MPIYEFYSPDTNKLYQFLARSLRYRDHTPRCPDGPDFKMERRVSRFAIIGKAKGEDEGDPFAGIDESKVDALMAEMEGEMAGLDDHNPNPRQIGHLMRKLTDVMGDRTPESLKELVHRLEAGEDPEKLEEQFGDLDSAEGEAGDALFSQMMKKIKAKGRPPKRDPKLYEITDYLD